jgi:hypothetical protein
MKNSLIYFMLLASVSCNQVSIEKAIQDKIDTGSTDKPVDVSVDIKEEVILTIAPLDMFNRSECTELKENIFMHANAYLNKNAQTINFQTTYFESGQDCFNDVDPIGYVSKEYLIRKISQLSSGSVTSYNIDLMVLNVTDSNGSTVNGQIYVPPMDELDLHHTKFTKIGDMEYMTFEKGPDYISFPFTYVSSGDSHTQRRSYTNEVMVVIPETQPIIFDGGEDGDNCDVCTL